MNHSLRLPIGNPAHWSRALALLAAVALLLLIGRSGWQAYAELQGPPPEEIGADAPAEPPALPERTASAPAAGQALGLFGTPPPQPVAAPEAKPIEAPVTRLKLTLRGVLASPEAQLARAIIAGPDGEDVDYGLGDELPGGARLHQILPDRAILERNGRHESLPLADEADSPPAAAAVPRPSRFVGRPTRM